MPFRDITSWNTKMTAYGRPYAAAAVGYGGGIDVGIDAARTCLTECPEERGVLERINMKAKPLEQAMVYGHFLFYLCSCFQLFPNL
jgi:hypothetical protein